MAQIPPTKTKTRCEIVGRLQMMCVALRLAANQAAENVPGTTPFAAPQMCSLSLQPN